MGPGDGVNDGRAYSSNEVWLEFGDGRYLFKLKLKQLAELQEKCNAGIGAIYMRVETGDYRIEDLLEGVRLGLVGGAKGIVSESEIRVTPEKARWLTETYCDRPIAELWNIALAVYRACMVGYSDPDAPPGKKAAAATETISEPDGSTSPRPTPTEQPLEE